MVEVVMKDTELSGYTWYANNAKPLWLLCFIEVRANTLKQAIEIVSQKYSDEKKYWIDKDCRSYMKLELIN